MREKKKASQFLTTDAVKPITFRPCFRFHFLLLLPPVQPTQQTASVANACRAAVDNHARTLAEAWGLISTNSPAATTTDQSTVNYQGNGYPSPVGLPLSPESLGPGVGATRTEDIGTWEGVEAKHEQWTTLWEALGVLSLPSVTVGAGEVMLFGRPCGWVWGAGAVAPSTA